MMEHRMAPTGIAEALAQAAEQIGTAQDLEGTLTRVLECAAATVPGVEFASLSLREKSKVRTVARTHPIADQVDQLQYSTGQGPCLDAIGAAIIFRTGDLAADTRWPDFGAAAAEVGVKSLMAFHLRRRGGPVLGALNLHSTQPDAYDDDAEHIGSLFAAHATLALVGTLDRTQLQEALATRDLIGTAKGILMHQHHISEDAAFGMLAAASQRSNRKLRDIAGWILTDANVEASRRRRSRQPQHLDAASADGS